MNGADLLRIIDAMHREKNIPKEIIFKGIEAAVQLATERHYGDEAEVDGRTSTATPAQIIARKGERDHRLPNCSAASPPRAPSR